MGTGSTIGIALAPTDSQTYRYIQQAAALILLLKKMSRTAVDFIPHSAVKDC